MEETVEEYAYRMQQGDRFPFLRVRFDGTNYYCEDGFHRLEAARRIGQRRIKALVIPGALAEMEATFQKYLNTLKKSLRRSVKTSKFILKERCYTSRMQAPLCSLTR
jgi:uncharacterized ParB-like nuclease family protein